jgi:hypothetical protein
MSQETTYAGIRGEWRDLIRPLAQNPPGLEHLEPFRAKLATILDQAVDVTQQQASLAAGKQQLSQDLKILMTNGQRLAAVLRKALKEHFGPRSEQLTAYNLQPFRGRKAKNGVEKPDPDGEISSPPDGSPAAR